MEASPFCRLCSENIIHDFVNIYDEEGQRHKVSEIIVQHFGIEIPPNDGYSTSICGTCWTITENFHRLYETVQLAESNLSSYEYPVDDSPDEMDQDGIENYTEYDHVVGESDLTDVKPSMIDDDNNSHINEDIDFKVEVKQEQHIEADNLLNTSTPTKYSPSGKSQDDIQRRRERIDMENQQIRNFFRMNCELCDLTFYTMKEATMHYRKQHKQAGYLVCCDKRFFRRCLALDHINHHIRSSPLQCDKCGKSYSSKFSLRNHMLEHEQDGDKPFCCEICNVTFNKQFQLSQHMRLRHSPAEKKNFGCDICGKFFVTKHVLSTHIRGVHENAFAHMCHICAKTFKSKQVFDLHQREHLDHEIPKLQCNICGAWLKHEHSLRKHMSRHADTAEVCKLCNKVAPNKHALGNHMRYVHSERAYKCTMCDKAFKKPIGLKEHMASHTGIDLYTCPYCPRTFKSGANMHSHRKKKHIEQWTQDRHQRFNSYIVNPSAPAAMPEVKKELFPSIGKFELLTVVQPSIVT